MAVTLLSIPGNGAHLQCYEKQQTLPEEGPEISTRDGQDKKRNPPHLQMKGGIIRGKSTFSLELPQSEDSPGLPFATKGD